MQGITVWIEAFSGLGLFLFGMLYLEAQIKVAAGRAFKRIVQNATATKFKSLLTGLSATALFQSSSVVTLMTLSLVGAQMMNLGSAIGVIFGSNIGTTVTTWIVALIGFKMDIKLLSYVMIGLGGLGGVMANESGKWRNYFGMMVGFGLIFLGLEGMKGSFEVFSKEFDLSDYLAPSPYWFALIGLAITAVIQSSSASVAIIQSALFTHMVSFEAAAAFVVGANIGTTVTAGLGAMGGIADKKRTAVAHLVFNLSTALVVLLTLPWLLTPFNSYLQGVDDVVRIALFHTFFNVVGVILWFPFIEKLASWVKGFFVVKISPPTHFIHNVPTDVPDLALEALTKEIAHLADKVEEYALLVINIPPPQALGKSYSVDKLLEKYDQNFDLSYDKLYEKIRLIEGEIYRYSSILSAKNSSETYQSQLDRLLRQNVYLATAAKSIKDMLVDIDRLYDAASSEEVTFYKNLRYQILKIVLAFHQAREGDEDAMVELEKIYKKIAASYKNSMVLIEDMAKNPRIKSEMTTIAINDMHLVKSFSKSLRNILNIADTSSD
ncbi:Na/Pi cotransporter family protein [Sulfurovum mangrovi]|uniref:Na/Pi cotransporter family protein n=1 Tax=Sulfurovum mangrovi TaxID=2893889 RepID=UPI001E3B3F08|nr:Na/Pi symporter [Sulfurovum mangrovi]UFH58618.1 Na/Pi symporter [Sulfurovum mangrovi]